MNLLSKIRVLDLSQRLPGPFACSHLMELGASVLKVEDPSVPDAFQRDEIKKVAPLFYDWYKSINKNKEVRKLSYTSLYEKLPKDFDLIITTLDQEKVKKFQIDKLGKIVLCLTSDEDGTHGAHDLNLLAKFGLLDLYLVDKETNTISPPYLPLAGIAFSYEIAMHALAEIIASQGQAKLVNVSMEKAIKKGLAKLNPSQKNAMQKHLINGAMPCYHVYRLKDGNFGALAAIEEHFWIKFCEDFKLYLHAEQRFDTTGEVLQKISNIFLKYTYEDLITKYQTENYCLSLIKKPTEHL